MILPFMAFQMRGQAFQKALKNAVGESSAAALANQQGFHRLRFATRVSPRCMAALRLYQEFAEGKPSKSHAEGLSNISDHYHASS